MPGEKRFGTSMFGFKKSDVNSYIEKMLREFEDKLKDKDEEISALKNQNRDIRFKYEELYKKADQIHEDRTKIADVLIKAQEKAQIMMEDARNQALEERKRLEEMVEQEREKLVDMKAEIRTLRYAVIDTLQKFEAQMGDIVGNEPAEAETEEETDEETEEKGH